MLNRKFPYQEKEQPMGPDPRRSAVVLALAGLALLVAILRLRRPEAAAPPPPPAPAGALLPTPSAPAPRAPTPPAPGGPVADHADPAPVLRNLRTQFVARWPRFDGHGWFGFRHRWHLGLCAARLSGLARPEATLRWIREELAAPDRKEFDRLFCVLLLSGLAETPHGEARDALAALLADPRREVGPAAAGALTEVDPALAPRDAFLQAAMAGNGAAIALFAVRREPDVPALLEGLKARTADPESDRALRIAGAVEKQALLQAPDWAVKVAEVIHAETVDPLDQLWTFGVVRATRHPDLVAALDRHLAGVEAGAEKRHAEGQRAIPEGKRTDFAGAFERADTLLIHDAGYDQGLLALRAAGGPMSDLRRRRLRYAGYDVDPSRRLAELAADPEWSRLLRP